MIEVVDRDGAVHLLRGGAVVALATDTVYGVAAALTHPDAVATLFAVKHRPASTALPVLVGSLDAARELATSWSDIARRLSTAFWPGPLTLVVACPRQLADLVGSNESSTGLRVPDDEALRSLLVETGPLAVTSANEHGHPPCRSTAEVLEVFAASAVAGVLDGGVRRGEVSTVVEVNGDQWRVVREGAITTEQLTLVLD